jgi:serine/threonine protein phosphatase PrpC
LIITFVEILELDLGKDDKFIILASDGVWEFLSNEEVANIVAPFFEVKNAEKAAEALVRESYLRWKREEEGIVDDITCVICFLDVKFEQQEPNPNLIQHEQAAAAAAAQATSSLKSDQDSKKGSEKQEGQSVVVNKPHGDTESPQSNKESHTNKQNKK